MKLFLKTLLLLSLSLLASCHDSEGQDAPFLETKMVDASLDRLRVFSIFQNKAAIQEAKNLQQAVSAFLDNVDLDHLQKLRSIWQSSHNKYLANQYGFFEPTETRRDLVFAVESWPIQPGFIDSLPHYPASGIVNDITLVMDLPTLRQQHGVTDREEVCLGYHAIEYLIFERNIEDFSTEGDQ
jgi:putative iron-regulated protein